MIEYDEQQTRKKKKKKKDSTSTWIVLGVVGGVVVVVALVLILVVKNMAGDNDAQAKGGAAQGQPAAAPPEQNVAHFGKHNPNPKGVVQSVRAAAYRPQRISDLKNIALFFIQFNAEFNRNPRTDDEFIKYIQREARDLAEALREKYYVLNLKARMASNSAIAYESLTEASCHQTAHGDGSVSLVTPEDLKTMLMP